MKNDAIPSRDVVELSESAFVAGMPDGSLAPTAVFYKELT